jgi:hypothetical protein
MNAQNQELFEEMFDERIGDFLYCGKNEPALTLYRKRVQFYIDEFNAGRVTKSAFDIVLKALLASGELRPIIFNDKSAEIAQKIADFEAGRIPVYNFRLACKADRELRDAYERHTGLAQLASGR